MIYYSYSKEVEISNLPKNIEEHAKTPLSKTAWSLLLKKYYSVFKEQLPPVTFLESGKPVIEGGYISISHSNGVVAVAFSKTNSVGIDVELVKEVLPKTLNFLGVSEKDFFPEWTRRESLIKAFNKSALTKDLPSFVGITQTLLVGEKKYSLSVYGKGCEIKLI
ncbi:MAG: hypothetical protein IKL82_05025 [Clostridia bacterium]|nr:hypothetical protein [Clostridia bacterium]